ncbi:MAG: hypothetical protein AAFN81_35505 [Bacteroidota bacterium]
MKTMNLERIKENYSRMSDEQIERIALFEMASLRSEVVEIVEREIESRGLREGLRVGIAVQLKGISEEEFGEVIDKIRNLPCPICYEVGKGLEGSYLRKVRSIIAFSSYEKTGIIACEDCLNTVRREALLKNIVMGWWEIPGGLYRTPQAILGHFSDKNPKNKAKISKKILWEFAMRNVGEIKANWSDEDKLVKAIWYNNEK